MTLDAAVARDIAGKSRVTIRVATKKSVGAEHMHAVVARLTGAPTGMVTVAESGDRKVIYHAKVYVDDVGASEQIIPKLTIDTLRIA